MPLLNEREVPPGVHHDVQHLIPVTVTMRWATGAEQDDALAVEWCGTGADAVVRVRLREEKRVMTGCVWLPASDVRRR